MCSITAVVFNGSQWDPLTLKSHRYSKERGMSKKGLLRERTTEWVKKPDLCGRVTTGVEELGLASLLSSPFWRNCCFYVLSSRLRLLATQNVLSSGALLSSFEKSIRLIFGLLLFLLLPKFPNAIVFPRESRCLMVCLKQQDSLHCIIELPPEVVQAWFGQGLACLSFWQPRVSAKIASSNVFQTNHFCPDARIIFALVPKSLKSFYPHLVGLLPPT